MLGAILSILAGIALILLSVIAVVLCTPLRMVAAFNSAQKPVADVKLSLLGGFLPLPAIRSAGAEKPAGKKRKPEKKRQRKKRTRIGVDIKTIIKAGPRLVSKLLNRIKIETLDANIGFGFPDPADTGMTYGMISPLAYWVDTSDKIALTVQPDFERARLDGKGRFAARMTPIAVLPPMLGFGWTVFAAPRLKRAFR